MSKRCTKDEMMLICAAREIQDGDKVIAGQGLPMVAAVLAKHFHAPHCILITEAGMVDFAPFASLLHVADPTAIKGYAYCCDMIDIFTTIANRGFVDVCFLGVAQVDRFGNVNTTVVGDYKRPKLRLTGSGGAPEFLAYSNRTVLTMRGGRFVQKLDYLTSPGFLTGGNAREEMGMPAGSGPTSLITTQGVFRFAQDTKELMLAEIFPGSKVEDIKKGVPWDLKISSDLRESEPPSPEHVEFMRRFEPSVPIGKRLTMEFYAKAMMQFLQKS